MRKEPITALAAPKCGIVPGQQHTSCRPVYTAAVYTSNMTGKLHTAFICTVCTEIHTPIIRGVCCKHSTFIQAVTSSRLLLVALNTNVCARVCSRHPVSLKNHKLAGGSLNRVVHFSLAVRCNVVFTYLIHACLTLHGSVKTQAPPVPLLRNLIRRVCTKQTVHRTLGDPSECVRAPLSPLYDVEVVSVLALVDDVLLGLHPQLKHGVQHL